MTSKLAENYNMSGKGEKTGFKSTTLHTVVLRKSYIFAKMTFYKVHLVECNYLCIYYV